MSETRIVRVALAAEGPTDFHLLEQALVAILGEVLITPLQPPRESVTTPHGNAGAHGGGWKGVRGWAGAARGDGQWAEALTAHDIVIVHVDADVAGDAEINVERDCPPPVDTVDALRPIVTGWIGLPIEKKCVLCVPSKASDAWLVVALNLAGAEIECDPNPAAKLRGVDGRPKAVTGAKPDKHAAGYRRLAPRVCTAWMQVTTTCSQAARFEAEVRAAMGTAP